jgi:hypothetical protein
MSMAGEAVPAAEAEAAESVATYLDSAAVYRGLLSASHLPPDAKVPPVFQVSFERDGQLERVTPAFDGLPQSHADRVIGLIAQHVKSQPPTPKKQTVRLYAESGSAARISIQSTSL